MIKIFSIFLDTRPFLEHFLKKLFLPLEKLKMGRKFLKFAQNEVKALSVSVLAAPRYVGRLTQCVGQPAPSVGPSVWHVGRKRHSWELQRA